jgi:transcriptional regulator with XRE-family HTH domain
MSIDRAAAGNAVDHHVGGRVRLGRERLGLSREILAERVARSEEEIERIEAGMVRLRSSELLEMAGHLEVPVSFFFKGLPPEELATNPSAAPEHGGDMNDVAEGFHLIKMFCRAPPPLRARILKMASTILGKPETERSESS